MDMGLEVSPPVDIEELAVLHEFSTTRYGGNPSIRDKGGVEAASWRPEAGMSGTYLFPQPVDKASALADAIITRHPYADGNKRTGLLAMGFLLAKEKLWIDSTSDNLVEMVLSLISHEGNVAQLSHWLTEHIRGDLSLPTSPYEFAQLFDSHYGDALEELAK